jgi:hypothetical protein
MVATMLLKVACSSSLKTARVRSILVRLLELFAHVGRLHGRRPRLLRWSGRLPVHRLGYTLGVGPRFALGQHLGIRVSAEYFNLTSLNQSWLFSGTLEYHF